MSGSEVEYTVCNGIGLSHCGCVSHRPVYHLAQANPLCAAQLFQKQLALAHNRVMNGKGRPAIRLSEVG